jgi:hypothetical protein
MHYSRDKNAQQNDDEDDEEELNDDVDDDDVSGTLWADESRRGLPELHGDSLLHLAPENERGFGPKNSLMPMSMMDKNNHIDPFEDEDIGKDKLLNKVMAPTDEDRYSMMAQVSANGENSLLLADLLKFCCVVLFLGFSCLPRTSATIWKVSKVEMPFD